MENPTIVVVVCPNCGDAPHRILRGKSSKDRRSLDAVVRCTNCGHVHHALIADKKDVSVRIIISDGKTSRRTEIELYPDDVIQVGDEFFAGGEYVQVRSIETKGKRVRTCRASEIATIWARRFDRVKVPISVIKGSKVVSKYIYASPDEEFEVGDVISIDNLQVAIQKIKVDRRGNPRLAQAREIVRLYTRIVR